MMKQRLFIMSCGQFEMELYCSKFVFMLFELFTDIVALELSLQLLTYHLCCVYSIYELGFLSSRDSTMGLPHWYYG